MTDVLLSEPVATALAEGRPVVALESTVYSNLGLPTPRNREALDRSVSAIEAVGAVPAVTAIVDGRMVAGLSTAQTERILESDRKTAERDLPVALGQRWDTGVTTVSASLAIAARAGIPVFATGGIGGVHRGSVESGDISSDLGAIARHGVATVSAGAKSFLDLPKTLEALETLGVPVVGWQTDVFPAFTARSSGLRVAHRCDDLEELAHLVCHQIDDFGRGILVAVPVPEADALDQDVHDRALEEALERAEADGVTGAGVTPFVLERIAAASGGGSIPANLALVENNAGVAARLAGALAATR